MITEAMLKYSYRDKKPQKIEEQKIKKVLAFAISATAVIVALVVVLNTVIIPKQKLNKAISMLESGDKDAVYSVLREIEDNDAAVMQRIYDRAVDLIDSGDYVPAFELLRGLDYKGSAKKQLRFLTSIRQKNSKMSA